MTDAAEGDGSADDHAEAVELVRRSLRPETREAFERRVGEQAETVLAALRSGELDNASFAVGLELEVYAVDGEGRLARLPEATFEGPVNRELGLHNAEVNTTPSVLGPAGVTEQAEELRNHLAAARRGIEDAADDRELVLDAMWTVPPEEGTMAYLSAVEEHGDEHDGVVLAENMYAAPRYRALDNDILRDANGTVELDLPGASATFPTILVESLTSSIQPHLQVPDAASFARYHDLGLRTLAPVLALTTNSPLLPVDLYDDPGPELLAETHHELRIPVFEQSINVDDPGKVRFPEDLGDDGTAAVVERLVEERATAPFLAEWTDGEADEAYSDTFPELDHKRGTHWRWLRGVVGGQPVAGDNDDRSIRIEYRPVPTQPSVADIVGVQCLVAGLLRGLVETDHPLATLEWERTRAGFYDVVANGLAAEIPWVTADGETTTDTERIYPELFDLARRGLSVGGFGADDIDRRLAPLEARWEHRTAPSDWKLARVREGIEDGLAFDAAVASAQREYRRHRGTPFAEWL